MLEEHDDELLNRNSTILLYSNLAFLLEFLIKPIAFERKMLFANRLNIMDLALSILFVTLFIIDESNAESFSLHHSTLILTNRYAFVTTLRAARLIMVAKVSKSIRILLECVGYTFNGIGNFLALLIIFLYVYALLGMQMFAGRLKFDENG